MLGGMNFEIILPLQERNPNSNILVRRKKIQTKSQLHEISLVRSNSFCFCFFFFFATFGFPFLPFFTQGGSSFGTHPTTFAFPVLFPVPNSFKINASRTKILPYNQTFDRGPKLDGRTKTCVVSSRTATQTGPFWTGSESNNIEMHSRRSWFLQNQHRWCCPNRCPWCTRCIGHNCRCVAKDTHEILQFIALAIPGTKLFAQHLFRTRLHGEYISSARIEHHNAPGINDFSVHQW